MNNSLKQYEQVARVTTGDGKTYYFPYSKLPEFKKALEEKKFIDIEGTLMAVWNIKTVEKDNGEGNNEIPKEYREQIQKRAEMYKENLGKPAQYEAKMKWVQMLREGKDIFSGK